jgi:hypothetical protein
MAVPDEHVQFAVFADLSQPVIAGGDENRQGTSS